MIKVASFFAGIGGIDLAFEKAGFSVVYANEIDSRACITYKKNFKNHLEEADIREIEIDKIPDFDILTAGFPCQAFSLAGYRKGFDDERGNLFFDLLKIISHRKPQIIFLENVKNLLGHDGGNTFQVISESLEKQGYYIKYQVMNAYEYGNVPQNRERIYIVGFLNKKQAEEFEFPKKIKLTKKIKRFISNKQMDDKYYYRNSKYQGELEKSVINKTTMYQWRRKYVRENKSDLCPTLTANMGTGGHNVPIIRDDYGIRKLTPRECFNFQGFDKKYKLPKIADSHLYKQAGNSVVVPVVEKIAKAIFDVL